MLLRTDCTATGEFGSSLPKQTTEMCPTHFSLAKQYALHRIRWIIFRTEVGGARLCRLLQ